MTSRNEEDDLCYIKIISTAGLLSSTHFTTTFCPRLVIKINPLPNEKSTNSCKAYK